MNHQSLRLISSLVRERASFRRASSCRMNSEMIFITFFTVSSGRFVLCVPLKISRCLWPPPKKLQSCSELRLSMSLSSSPLMKTTIVDLLILAMSALMSSCSMSYRPLSWMSDRSLQNTQGKRQLMRQFGMYFGEFSLAMHLQRLLNDTKDESATIIGAFPYLSAVAAPMLRPHSTIRSQLLSRNLTTLSTCSASRTPRLMMSSSWLWPQPMKSKEAREKRQGRNLMIPVASSREEEFPWRQRMIHSDLLSGSKSERVMSLFWWFTSSSFLSYLVSLRTKVLDPA